MNQLQSVFKLTGQGNDFIVYLAQNRRIEFTVDSIRRLCDRHYGIGSDGFIIARKPEEISDRSQPYEICAEMELFNADGSLAEISGNGIRCLGKVLWDANWAQGDTALIASASGIRKLVLREVVDDNTSNLSVEMGDAVLEKELAVEDLGWIGGEVLHKVRRAYQLRIGNPHCVLVVDDVSEIDLDYIGELAQAQFPSGINLEIISEVPPKNMKIFSGDYLPDNETPDGLGGSSIFMRVFERGVGLTLACGSGSCAAALCSSILGISDRNVDVINPGGTLNVSLNGSSACLSGPVVSIGAIETTLLEQEYRY